MSPTNSLPKKQMKFIDRKLDNGMGMAVAKRTYLRRVTDPQTDRERWETWREVAERVALGNTLLIDPKQKKHREAEYPFLHKKIYK